MKRLGSISGAEEIKQHEFFKDIDWKALLEKKIKSPLNLKIKKKNDIRYFDEVNFIAQC